MDIDTELQDYVIVHELLHFYAPTTASGGRT